MKMSIDGGENATLVAIQIIRDTLGKVTFFCFLNSDFKNLQIGHIRIILVSVQWLHFSIRKNLNFFFDIF